jgi:hypothetical protein
MIVDFDTKVAKVLKQVYGGTETKPTAWHQVINTEIKDIQLLI